MNKMLKFIEDTVGFFAFVLISIGIFLAIIALIAFVTQAVIERDTEELEVAVWQDAYIGCEANRSAAQSRIRKWEQCVEDAICWTCLPNTGFDVELCYSLTMEDK